MIPDDVIQFKAYNVFVNKVYPEATHPCINLVPCVKCRFLWV